MSKRSKKTQAEEAPAPEETLEVPAGTATETAASAIDWPESTETRQLDVELTDEEAHEQALKLIERMRHSKALQREKKASAKEFDNQIDEVEQEVLNLTEVVDSKRLRRDVSCFWLFEVNGHDKDGNCIMHSGMKTLFRSDNGAVVESLPISQEDRQMVLPLDDAETLKLNLEKLKELGWSVMEAPDDIEHDSPFQAVNADSGVTTPIRADSLAGAVQAVLDSIAHGAFPHGEEQEAA